MRCDLECYMEAEETGDSGTDPTNMTALAQCSTIDLWLIVMVGKGASFPDVLAVFGRWRSKRAVGAESETFRFKHVRVGNASSRDGQDDRKCTLGTQHY